MCSLTVTSFLSGQLAELGQSTTEMIERDLKEKAGEANLDSAGLLDHKCTYLRSGFAKDLRQAGVRKEAVGRHRVYFVGNNTDCNYDAFFVKTNKKKDNAQHDDNNPDFHEMVRNALSDKNIARVLRSAKEEQRQAIVSPPEEAPAYQLQDWFKKQQQYLNPASETDLES